MSSIVSLKVRHGIEIGSWPLCSLVAVLIVAIFEKCDVIIFIGELNHTGGLSLLLMGNLSGNEWYFPGPPFEVPWSFPPDLLNDPDVRSISPLILAFTAFLTSIAALEHNNDKKLELPELCKVTSKATDPFTVTLRNCLKSLPAYSKLQLKTGRFLSQISQEKAMNSAVVQARLE